MFQELTIELQNCCMLPFSIAILPALVLVSFCATKKRMTVYQTEGYIVRFWITVNYWIFKK